MWFSLVISLCSSMAKGVFLGGLIYMAGEIMDDTVSENSKHKLEEEKPYMLMYGQQQVFTNLVIISPIVYGLMDCFWLSHTGGFTVTKYGGLIFIQNIGYFLVHRAMHLNRGLYKYHKLHHQFDTLVIPSIGNAVSQVEFCLAYMMPLISGAFVVQPNETTFLAAIGTIGIFNILIHTPELEGVWWIPGFVSPTFHIEHHRKWLVHYAAPLLDIDMFFSWIRTRENTVKNMECVVHIESNDLDKETKTPKN
jgi:sterol desaturase/sphingolipid hydroxylase (fatty acid hydroxylase superfamily)